MAADRAYCFGRRLTDGSDLGGVGLAQNSADVVVCDATDADDGDSVFVDIDDNAFRGFRWNTFERWQKLLLDALFVIQSTAGVTGQVRADVFGVHSNQQLPDTILTKF